MHASIQALEAENKTLRGDIAKLQTQVQTLTNDVLIVQTRVEHQPSLPVIRPIPQVVEQKPVEAPKKMYRQESFLGDDIHFTDEEPPALSSAGTTKFTNKDLGAPLLPNTPNKTLTNSSLPAKSKSGAFTEQTLVADTSKNEPAKASVEDPAIVASYNRAYKTFQDQNYKETVRLMDEFLKQYPSHKYSDNATFWIGESYYQLKNYEQANAEFEKVISKYPNGNKVPDALLRSGICMLKLSKPEKAKVSFDQLIKKYPESVAAKKAKATLGDM
ncbi:MAG: tol-pal system protein YbgF [Bdellovibrionota bacterium]